MTGIVGTSFEFVAQLLCALKQDSICKEPVNMRFVKTIMKTFSYTCHQQAVITNDYDNYGLTYLCEHKLGDRLQLATGCSARKLAFSVCRAACGIFHKLISK